MEDELSPIDKLKNRYGVSNHVKTFGQRLKDISERPKIDLIKFGIAALDDTLMGLMPADLITIGAVTGGGKTSLGALIAHNIAKNNKKVLLYALESDINEIECKYIFNELKTSYYSRYRQILRYKKWVLRQYDDNKDVVELEKDIIEKAHNKLQENLFTRYRAPNEGFTASTLNNELALIKNVDCIIVDHLGYFSLDETKSENKAVEDVILQLREIARNRRTPIILVAHLRKKHMANKALCPDLSEFHGTSNITKISTGAVTIAPAFDIEKDDIELPTYFRICKERFENVSSRYLIVHKYHSIEGTYSDKYYLYKGLNEFTKRSEKLSGYEVPWWGKDNAL